FWLRFIAHGPPPRLRSLPTRRSSALESSRVDSSILLHFLDDRMVKARVCAVGHDADCAFLFAVLVPHLSAAASQRSHRRIDDDRSEEHTSELQSREKLVRRPPLEKNT